ncbi:unnamed protein product [Parnassius apollo]|uniref:(apollo) hypothetical protein n=1 Tax=Parnassius apollo TaxID=110799 RepID=A0A8S3XUT8_PARAO|nr:unnamed protein product [Parnassius apollo]
MIELEMQIEQLKQTLQAANTEVDNLILQNNDLQRELENCQMVIKSLRAIQTLGPKKIRGGNHKQILKHFDLYTKDLKENDLAVILIGNYDIKMGTSYVDEIRRIVSKENRKFNILLGSIIYDNINDDKIFTINKELFNLAAVSENVRYLEINVKVKSINNKYLELKLLTENTTCDVLCLTETWTNELKLGVMTIEGFILVSYYNRMLFEHGGTAIFVRHSLEYKIRHDIVKLSIEMNCELAAIEVKSSKLVIICVYRPDYDYLIFEDIMTKVIEKIGRENKRIVIAGDFNLNLLKPNNKVSKFLKLLSELKCKFVLNEPTRTKGKSSTCIDNFILNDDDDFQYHRGKVLDVKLSDHNVIELKYKLNSKYPKPKEKTEVRSRIISQENIKYFHYLFCKDFECVRKDVNLKLDANEKMNILIDYIQYCYYTAFPLKTIKPIKNKNKLTTKGILISRNNLQKTRNIA